MADAEMPAARRWRLSTFLSRREQACSFQLIAFMTVFSLKDGGGKTD